MMANYLHGFSLQEKLQESGNIFFIDLTKKKEEIKKKKPKEPSELGKDTKG